MGPDHVYVVPATGELTLSDRVCPLQMGVLAANTGAGGADGSTREKLRAFDGQPFSVTIILVYDPLGRLGMVYVVTPAPVLKLMGVCGVPP